MREAGWALSTETGLGRRAEHIFGRQPRPLSTTAGRKTGLGAEFCCDTRKVAVGNSEGKIRDLSN